MVGIRVKVNDTYTDVYVDKRFPISINDIVDFGDDHKLNLSIILEKVLFKSYKYRIAGRMPKKAEYNLYVFLYGLCNRDYRFELIRLKQKMATEMGTTTPETMLNVINGYTGNLMDGTHKFF